MDFFELPESTKIGKVIHKNVFNQYLTSAQKKLFVDLINKITWTNKLSSHTVNLSFIEYSEIQVFKIDLKKVEKISTLLDIIDTYIPYHIIFVLCYKDMVQLSISIKHLHPSRQNSSVIDWTFHSDWISTSEFQYRLSLKRSIDFVLKDLCLQLSGEKDVNIDITTLIASSKRKSSLERDILILESKIKDCKQFNLKVELNLRLLELKKKSQ